MSEEPRIRRPWRRRLLWGFGIVVVLLLADWLAASWVMWSSYDRLLGVLENPGQNLLDRQLYLQVDRGEIGQRAVEHIGDLEVHRFRNPAFIVSCGYKGKSVVLDHDCGPSHMSYLWSGGTKAVFECPQSDLGDTRRALAEIAHALPRVSGLRRAAVSVALHPLLIGARPVDQWCWLVWFKGGRALIGNDGWPRQVQFSDGAGRATWTVTLRRSPTPASCLKHLIRPDTKAVQASADEFDRSLAAAIRILALQWQPVPKEPDKVVREGKGWLEVKDGRRVLHLSGTAREIGYQHGRLLAPNIKRMGERILGGVGLAYSLEKGQWFLREAEKLVERQRPYIAPEYFEEMQGIADGAGVPVAMVQAANIFPEFFHCSGAALFGKATKDGGLLHARVLDYMTEVGLQDDAVVMAIARTGARRIVNVSYAGFIGSVTGMNERQVAIGEMGGGGVGKWDGTPMSFLVRGALENSDTLEQALDYMRSHKRTCEYFYVISDGKSRSACGVAATPEKLEIVGPGQADPRLPDPVPDTVLLSSGDRYKELVKKVRENYGKIGPAELIEIIKRPVAMKSNLHDVIFEPQKLALWVANADRNGPACNQPYAAYDWKQLFRAEP